MGAGSVVFTRQLVADLLRFDDLGPLDLSLHDVDQRRLDVAEGTARQLGERSGRPLTVQASLDRRTALAGADFVVDMVQIGGVAATPVRARATEEALTGRPWSQETVRRAADVMAAEGTPLSGAMIDAVQKTINAAVVDSTVAAAVLTGRLVAPVDLADLEADALGAAVAGSVPGVVPAAAPHDDLAARRARKAAERAVREPRLPELDRTEKGDNTQWCGRLTRPRSWPGPPASRAGSRPWPRPPRGSPRAR